MYGGVRGRKTRVGEKLHRFPPTRSLFPNLPLSYTVIGSHNFNPLNSGFYIEYQRNKEQYKREDIAS